MSEAVVDSSVALTWCFEDEASAETDALFERVRDEGAMVPGLWYLELSNVLLQAEKRGRISGDDVAARLDLIAELPISVAQETTVRAWREILTLARAEGLTTHDAAYLEIATRRGLIITPLDVLTPITSFTLTVDGNTFTFDEQEVTVNHHTGVGPGEHASLTIAFIGSVTGPDITSGTDSASATYTFDQTGGAGAAISFAGTVAHPAQVL